jgi:hypothetical protein
LVAESLQAQCHSLHPERRKSTLKFAKRDRFTVGDFISSVFSLVWAYYSAGTHRYASKAAESRHQIGSGDCKRPEGVIDV